MRYILLIIAIIAALLILKQLYGPRKKPTHKKMPPSKTIVRCEHCGVHIPQEEALHINQHYFCSEEHRRLHDK